MDRFFLQLYRSSAEPLPTGFDIVGNTAHIVDDPSSGLREVKEALEGDCGPVELFTSVQGDDLVGLARRFLPPGCISDLYWCYLASLSVSPGDEEPASFTTFWRRWVQVWHGVLRFRTRMEHSKCNTCFRYQQLMKVAHSMADKLKHAMAYRQHLAKQFSDRSLYWSLRAASRDKGPVLTIILDGMDKSKFRLPKYPFHARPKELDELSRPTLHVVGAIAHGWLTDLFITTESVFHGADFYCEVLAQVIQRVSDQALAEGRRLPSHVVIQAHETFIAHV